MFKKEKKSAETKAADAPQKPEAPVKSAMQIEAEKAIARGARISSLSSEAEMWRRFEKGCKEGRYVAEHAGYYIADQRSMLSAWMDGDTAPLWAAFARQMGDERERRLKDVLGT